MNDATEVFTRIYNGHEWGGLSRSGPGSDLQLLKPYLDVLGAVIEQKSISSVVDIGCGDWALSKHVNWNGLNYIGIDIVPELVNALNNSFGTNNIRFVKADLTTSDLPVADLCIVK